jgi:hypothetical protein
MRWLRLDDSIEVWLVMSYDLNDGRCTDLDKSSWYHTLLLELERWQLIFMKPHVMPCYLVITRRRLPITGFAVTTEIVQLIRGLNFILNRKCLL